MALNRRWIKLGRLFMVAWLSFFIYPVAALVTARFDSDSRVFGLALLLALALLWGWFWLRIVAGPDRRFAVPVTVVATLLLVPYCWAYSRWRGAHRSSERSFHVRPPL